MRVPHHESSVTTPDLRQRHSPIPSAMAYDRAVQNTTGEVGAAALRYGVWSAVDGYACKRTDDGKRRSACPTDDDVTTANSAPALSYLSEKDLEHLHELAMAQLGDR